MTVPYYPNGPPPKKTSLSGCYVALAVVFGLFLVTVLGVAIVVYGFFQSPTGKKITDVARKGGKLLGDAATAPGTAEMRALGCRQALVLDTETMIDLVKDLVPDGGTVTSPTPGTSVRFVLLCTLARSGPPTCEDVARAYFAVAPSPPGRVAVTVNVDGAKKAQCTAVFEPSGAKVTP